ASAITRTMSPGSARHWRGSQRSTATSSSRLTLRPAGCGRASAATPASRWSTPGPAVAMSTLRRTDWTSGWQTKPPRTEHAHDRSPRHPEALPRHAAGAVPARVLAEETVADPAGLPALRLADRTGRPRRTGLRGNGALAHRRARPRQRPLDAAHRPVRRR